jgi:WD40 repeat protein
LKLPELTEVAAMTFPSGYNWGGGYVDHYSDKMYVIGTRAGAQAQRYTGKYSDFAENNSVTWGEQKPVANTGYGMTGGFGIAMSYNTPASGTRGYEVYSLTAGKTHDRIINNSGSNYASLTVAKCHPSGKYFVEGKADGLRLVWITNNTIIPAGQPSSPAVTAFGFHPFENIGIVGYSKTNPDQLWLMYEQSLMTQFGSSFLMRNLKLPIKGAAKDIEFSPDGKMFAVAMDGAGARVQLFHWPDLREELLDVSTITDNVAMVQFSPDGKYLIVGAGERAGNSGNVWCIDLVTKEVTKSANFGGVVIRGMFVE